MIYKFIYKIILFIIFPIVFIYTFLQSILLRDFKYFENRFNSYLKLQNKNDICIHCASLGEINGAKDLIKEINKNNNILISINTISGKKRAIELFPELDVVYFPLDYKYIAANWLKNSQVKSVLIYETEIWLNFYNLCKEKNIKICVINGRISKEVLTGPKILKKIYKEALDNCSFISCKSDYEKEKYLSLNIDESLLFTLGNLKYSCMPDFADELSPVRNKKDHEETSEIFSAIENRRIISGKFISDVRLSNRNVKNYFLMASTHEPDEKYFLESIKYLTDKGTPVIIAPRHISRSKKISKFFNKNNIKTFLYSSLKEEGRYASSNWTGVLILDTFGDLLNFYYDALYIYVGGGFSKRGVQNVIEPSTSGRPILVGPNIDNFYEEIINLRKDKGITVIDDDEWLPAKENVLKHIKYLDNLDLEMLKEIGGIAKAYTLKFNGVVEKYVKFLKEKKIID
jgi:3-deoxy-D-manno-octulosonic-acid transferase